MFENEESVNTVEVAEPQENDTDVTSEVVENTESVANSQQSVEENARFAEMRRKQEYDSLKTRFAEKEQSYNQLESTSNAFRNRVQSVLGNYFEADSLEDMLLMAEAQAKGVNTEDLRVEREKIARAEEERNNLLEQLEYYQKMEKENLEKQAIEMVKADLEELQKIDPSIKNLEQLGEDFTRLRFTINPLTDDYYSVGEIYNHLKSKVKPLPANSGKIQSVAKDNIDPQFLSSEEVDKLTADDYDKNPKLFEIVRKSMLKW